ncbi:hypothetical protein [Streptomyces sp. NPDC048277]|uniref:hypothetical protein n=1 Tax=Streptomyces sp. NPDC048277 TaxID=3155027 RepID=UPI0033E93E66
MRALGPADRRGLLQRAAAGAVRASAQLCCDASLLPWPARMVRRMMPTASDSSTAEAPS